MDGSLGRDDAHAINVVIQGRLRKTADSTRPLNSMHFATPHLLYLLLGSG